MTLQYADLEISIHRRDEGTYSVDFRLSRPDSDETRTDRSEIKQSDLDFDGLADASYDSDEYSRKLTGGFFKSQGVKSYFSSAKSSVLSRDGMGLRLRLFVGSDAPELHPLHWELLRDPDTNFLIATSQDILFSRYLSSLDWRPVRLKPKSEMQALVVVANPSDLEANHFAPIHVEAELARARQALDDIPVTAIPAGSGEHATLTKIVAKLAENEYDILYIVCHGALSGADEPVLWLEGEDGRAKKTFGKDLVVRLQELPQRPRLVVLASCESAGNSAGEALSALGPRLVEAGIPAVLAMQGKVSVQTIEQFMPRFFESVRQEGHIDQAMAVARGLVRDRPDSWMPVLFMRLKSGRLWYVPGYADEQKFDRWRALISDIEMKKVTPIIGPGTFEPLNICIRGIAERWAEAFQYPMAQYERDSIPKVAQFLSADQSATFPYAQLVSYLRSDIQKRYKNDLDESMLAPRAPLMELIDQVGARRRERNPEEAYRILAQLPFKIFVTTDTNNLLANALREAGKEPTVMLCPWNKYTAKQVANASLDEFEPDEKHPIVFHVFGLGTRLLNIRDSKNPIPIIGPGELQHSDRIPRQYTAQIDLDLNKHLTARRAYYFDDYIEVLYGVYYLEHILIADDMLATYGLFYDFIRGKESSEQTTEQYYKDVVAIQTTKEFREISVGSDSKHPHIIYLDDAPTFTLSLADGEKRTVTFVNENYFKGIKEKIDISEDSISKIYWVRDAEKMSENAIKALRFRLRIHKGANDDNPDSAL